MKTSSFQVLATLAYTDQFNYPLTEREIWERLVKIKAVNGVFKSKKNQVDLSHKKINLSPSQVKTVLDQLVKKKLVVKKKNLYVLDGSEKYFKVRKSRRKISRKKEPEINRFLNFARKIQWIKAVAITGAQAMQNASHETDDIDFLLVTAKNRLWLVRPIVIMFSFICGKKALFWQKNKRIKDDWCFNLWLDEDNLALSRGRRNFYTAYEVGQAKWIFDREECGGGGKKFTAENEWVREFLPNILGKSIEYRVWSMECERIESGFFDKAFSYLNKVFFYLQFNYLVWKLKIPQKNATEGMAYLHLGNMKRVVYNGWRQSLKRLSDQV